MSDVRQPDGVGSRRPGLARTGLLTILAIIMGGCSVTAPRLLVKETGQHFAAGDIIEAKSGQAIGFDRLVEDLKTVEIVYVGERHPDSAHHQIQLKIIQALAENPSMLAIGMEMFDHTYQPVLDRWSAGDLDQEHFLKLVHWYANWRYDFGLYQPILDYVRQHGLRLIGLNIPFSIPPKIAIGGIDSLSPEDKSHLPKHIDTSDPAHRAYVEAIFKLHSIKGRRDFESFYAAQCVWEDAMAETIANHLDQGKMVVLAGNGHIIRKFGIPQRAFSRNGKAFRTIYLAEASEPVELAYADYIWVTPPEARMPARSPH
jgi:uncharacterized iron-regulated protein